MTAYVALLRAVNVGGTGKLPMTELKAMCEAAGFEKVPHLHRQQQRGLRKNLTAPKPQVKTALEKALHDYAGKSPSAGLRPHRRGDAPPCATTIRSPKRPATAPSGARSHFSGTQPAACRRTRSTTPWAGRGSRWRWAFA